MVDVDYFKEKLLSLRQETLDLIERGEDSTKPVALDQTMVGRVSRIDAIQQQEMALNAKRRREEIVVRIDQALKRIEVGEFGYCLNCGDEIDQKRLKINSMAVTCVDCA